MRCMKNVLPHPAAPRLHTGRPDLEASNARAWFASSGIALEFADAEVGEQLARSVEFAHTPPAIWRAIKARLQFQETRLAVLSSS